MTSELDLKSRLMGGTYTSYGEHFADRGPLWEINHELRPPFFNEWEGQVQKVSDCTTSFFARLPHYLYPHENNSCVVRKNRPQHFWVFNKWRECTEGDKFKGKDKFAYVIDESTGDPYLNEDNSVIRGKCAKIILGNLTAVVPLYYFAASIGYLFYDLSHGQFQEAAVDLGRIQVLPVVLTMLFAAAVFGLLCPYQGRKLYAAIERTAFCGLVVLAPCFQPYPTSHFFGSPLLSENGA